MHYNYWNALPINSEFAALLQNSVHLQTQALVEQTNVTCQIIIILNLLPIKKLFSNVFFLQWMYSTKNAAATIVT